MADKKTHREMEVAFLHEDQTWFTEVLEIRLTGDYRESVRDFWHNNLSKLPEYRKIVSAFLFDESPEPRD